LSPDTSRPRPRLILMMKAPRPGRVKTRLAAEIGAETAVELYRRFVEFLARRLLSDPGRPWQPVVAFDPPEAGPAVEAWLRPLVAPDTIFHPQREGDLGERLRDVFVEAFEAGAPAVLAIGTDCLEITPAEIESCLADLRTPGVVMGEACDGGYWIIGMARPWLELFEEMPWSGVDLAEATRRKAASGGIRLIERAVRLDVDRLSDLERLPEAILQELDIDLERLRRDRPPPAGA
jgi:uncharacterized protein